MSQEDRAAPDGGKAGPGGAAGGPPPGSGKLPAGKAPDEATTENEQKAAEAQTGKQPPEAADAPESSAPEASDSPASESPASDPLAGAPAEPINDAQAAIAAFGGIRPMAAKLRVAVSTVQGWKERDAIPASRHAEIRTAAAELGLDLDKPAPSEAAAEAESGATPDLPALPAASPAGTARERLRTSPAKPPGEAAPKAQGPQGPQEKKPERPAASPLPASGPKPPPSSTPEPARGPGWIVAFLLGAVAVSLGFGGAVMSRGQWLPILDPPVAGGPVVDDAAVAALSQRLDRFNSTLDTQGANLRSLQERFEAQPPAAGGSADTEAVVASLRAEFEEVASRESGLETRIAALEERREAGAGAREAVNALDAEVSAELEDLDARAAVLEARLSDLDRLGMTVEALSEQTPAAARDVAIMLSLVQLRDSFSRGAAYGEELAGLRQAIGDDAEMLGLLGPLEAHAGSGLPTPAALAEAFGPVARAVVAAGPGGDEEGLLAGAWRSLSGVVTVRPVGEVEGEGPGAVVARAEARLRDGDLAGALAQLSALEGAAAEAAAAWKEQAEARLAGEAALVDLGILAVDRLAEAG
ncbi:MAG: hypothetical protein QNJ67_21495 [Kiloniellales bacterium]|nr:hypothetical protein [Kiloniellales bacterium]